MSDNNLDYQRGYTEMVRLCAMMLIVQLDTREGHRLQAFSTSRAENLRDECARLLNLFSMPVQFDKTKHDEVFQRLIAIFTEVAGDNSNAWLSYQPAMQLLRGHVN